MPKLSSWVRPKRGRPRTDSVRSPASAAPSPRDPARDANRGSDDTHLTGDQLFANNRLFNEDALKNSAELEPIDNPMRSTTPHHPLVIGALGFVLLGVTAWLAFGSVDHSLWLKAERLDGAGGSPVPANAIRLRAEVSAPDGERIQAGMRAFVFLNDFDGAFTVGSIARVASATSSHPTPPDRAVVVFDFAPGPSEAPWHDASVEYRLRIPLGSQTPMGMLIDLIGQERRK